MQIQPIVIGTAGHIDHGKSTLVRALTGVDPDRLKEEKERGLTIDLGFAPLELPDGRLVGIVDVPGHERFIRNMVAGATGIDLVVLVVAADDGVMPQTREHLAIMELLGVQRGFVALTKVDAVDPELVELAREDVEQAVAGTFLEGAPVLAVSAVDGTGLDELRELLVEMAAGTEPRSMEGVFRMPIQRVFSAPGFGTIVTGIPVSGALSVGDPLEILPGGFGGRVRGIQAYRQATKTARAGHSTAINLSDVEHRSVSRGCAACAPGFFRPARMLGARLTALPSLSFPVVDRMRVRVHLGTAEALGEVVLLDRQEHAPGESGLVQLRLEEPLVAAPGDRFVLRLASPMITLGGGTVLEESRHRLKRFKGFVIEELGRQEQSLESAAGLLGSILHRAGAALLAEAELAVAIKREPGETRELLRGLRERGEVASPGPPGRWIHSERLEEALGLVRERMAAWFEENPLRQVIDIRELRSLAGLDASLLGALLEVESARGGLSLEPGGLVRPTDRQVELDPETEALRARVLALLEEAGFQPPLAGALPERVGASRADFDRVMELLLDQGLVRHIGKDLYLAAAMVERARAEVVENCGRHGHLEIPELRDLLGTTRKFLIPLLEYLDAQGLTHRQGAHRVLKRR